MTIEAVNSVLSNAPYTRAVAEQASVAKSLAANPNRVQEVAQQPRYLSLYLKMDVNFDKAILLMRDGDTGDVVRQIPTESQLEAYKRAQNAALQQQTAAPRDLPDPVAVDVNGGVPETTVTTTTISTPEPTTIGGGTSDTSFAPKAGNIVSIDTQA